MLGRPNKYVERISTSLSLERDQANRIFSRMQRRHPHRSFSSVVSESLDLWEEKDIREESTSTDTPSCISDLGINKNDALDNRRAYNTYSLVVKTDKTRNELEEQKEQLKFLLNVTNKKLKKSYLVAKL